jgi:small GTP-binding protein
MTQNIKEALRRIEVAKSNNLRIISFSKLGLTSLPDELWELENLERLMLPRNNLTKIPDEIIKLKRLKSININRNYVKDISSNITKLQNLTQLTISRNELTEVPEVLLKIPNLLGLNLSKNNLSDFPDIDFNSNNLKSLDLSGNIFEKTPNSISSFKNLERLRLGRNKLKDINIDLSVFANLLTLDLRSNRLEEIPENIGVLTNLIVLFLKDNNLQKIPSSIEKLTNLQRLTLDSNKLRFLPNSIAELDNLEGSIKISNRNIINKITVSDNPLISPPLEIASKGYTSIKKYFNSISNATEIKHLSEVKLILVGEGRVGKTALVKSLVNDNYVLEDELSTEGIDITDWNLKIPELAHSDDVNVHLWDFGGQEIYHSTHQFFLTTRAVYLYVLETRRDESIDDYYYWLNSIRLLGGNSPVIVVINKSDQPTDTYDLNEFKRFNSNAQEIVFTSCKNGKGIKELKNIIKNKILNLDHLGTPFDNKWIEVRKELEVLKNIHNKDYISKRELDTICLNQGIAVSEIPDLYEIFHELGVFVYFYDDINLQDIVILNPEWTTHGVYKILDSNIEKGQFDKNDIKRIWNKNLRYKYNQSALIALMKKFEICFEINNNSQFIAPQILPKETPNFSWKNKDDKLHFSFEYDFMPKGIISNFIVKRHNDIFNNTYWRYGVFLEWNDTQALIIEEYHLRKISISVSGKNKSQFLVIIRNTISEVHKKYHNLKFSEKIGCVCDGCKKARKPYFFDTTRLEIANNKNIELIQCQSTFDEIKLSKLFNLYREVSLDEIYSLESQLELLQESIDELQDTTSCLVLTEDKDTSLCETVLSANGFNLDETEIYSFGGKDNLISAIISTDILIQNKPHLKTILFHIDKDYHTGEEYLFINAREKIQKRNNGNINCHLFITTNYDLESYFLNPNHIHKLINEELSIDLIKSRINEATDKNEEHSLSRLFIRLKFIEESRKKERKSYDSYKEGEKLKKLYTDNKTEFRYGKKVLKTLKSFLQEDLKRNTELEIPSEYLIIEELQTIKNKIWE